MSEGRLFGGEIGHEAAMLYLLNAVFRKARQFVGIDDVSDGWRGRMAYVWM